MQTVGEMASGMADWTSSMIFGSDDLVAGTGGLAEITVIDDQEETLSYVRREPFNKGKTR